ncbi:MULTISPECIES: hypothetical protein [Rahnella]|uniref:hypothetical protein n=1 Tax=Rahnella TaxID=34037 RepID=UPI003F6DBD2D
MSKLIKATVRKSGNIVYVGRIQMVRVYKEEWPAGKTFSFSNGNPPAQLNTRQRYMRIAQLSVQ